MLVSVHPMHLCILQYIMVTEGLKPFGFILLKNQKQYQTVI